MSMIIYTTRVFDGNIELSWSALSAATFWLVNIYNTYLDVFRILWNGTREKKTYLIPHL